MIRLQLNEFLLLIKWCHILLELPRYIEQKLQSMQDFVDRSMSLNFRIIFSKIPLKENLINEKIITFVVWVPTKVITYFEGCDKRCEVLRFFFFSFTQIKTNQRSHKSSLIKSKSINQIVHFFFTLTLTRTLFWIRNYLWISSLKKNAFLFWFWW